VEHLFRRRLNRDEFVNRQLVDELTKITSEIGREIAILFSRDGKVLDIFLTKKNERQIPELSGYAQVKNYYSRLRIVKTSFNSHILEQEILLLKRLRLDCLVILHCGNGNRGQTVVVRTPPGAEDPLRFIRLDGKFDGIKFSELIDSYEEELARFRKNLDNNKGYKKALIVGCGIEPDSDIAYYIDELRGLLSTLGIFVVESIWQKKVPESAYLVGKGKLSEVQQIAGIYESDMIVFFNTLSPVQKKNIEDETGFQILDRNQIILDIFANRAKSNEGKLQVELAYLKYQLPRLTERDAGLSRLVGGFKTKGPGETRLEVMRRRFREKIAFLNRRIERLRARREFTRQKRKLSGIPLVAITGYTNAGKSTLLNRITKSNVYVEDKLFATLDPATRRYTYPDGFSILFSDTVGFIKDLPGELKSAFMATFEEINCADLILNVADISNSNVYNQIEAVEEILLELGADHIPRLLVLNKADRIKKSDLRLKRTDGIMISALAGEGIDILIKKIRDSLFSS